jgi:hypothetical protein
MENSRRPGMVRSASSNDASGWGRSREDELAGYLPSTATAGRKASDASVYSSGSALRFDVPLSVQGQGTTTGA